MTTMVQRRLLAMTGGVYFISVVKELSRKVLMEARNSFFIP